MWLKHHPESPRGPFARGSDGHLDLGWMMCIVFENRDSAAPCLDLESAPNSSEGSKPGGEAFTVEPELAEQGDNTCRVPGDVGARLGHGDIHSTVRSFEAERHPCGGRGEIGHAPRRRLARPVTDDLGSFGEPFDTGIVDAPEHGAIGRGCHLGKGLLEGGDGLVVVEVVRFDVGDEHS